MVGYFPKNILAYIAVHSAYRRKGIAQLVMQHAMRYSDGDVALHIEKK